MFYQLPDSLFKDELAKSASPTALITVSGEGSISAAEVQDQIARLVPTQSQWRWEAIPNGDKAFLISIPAQHDLDRVNGMEVMVRANKVVLSISTWSMDEIVPSFELQQVWVHVSGVPHQLRHFLGLWGVGSVIGTTLDVDLLSLRRRGLVRILVGMIDISAFMHDDNGQTSLVSSNLVVKLKGYEFRYELEQDDFAPEADFSLFMWKKPDDLEDKGNENAGGTDSVANKRLKNNVSDSSTSSQQHTGTVPMNMTTTLSVSGAGILGKPPYVAKLGAGQQKLVTGNRLHASVACEQCGNKLQLQAHKSRSSTPGGPR